MSFPRWLATAILAAMPFAIAAQEKPGSTDPADPQAAAASYRYESAFAGYQSMPQEDAPGPTWRAANDEMGALGGHAGHIKAKEQSKSVSADAPGPGNSLAPQTPKATPADHGGHGMHPQHQGQ